MTDAASVAFGVLVAILIVVVIVAIVLIVAWALRESRRRRAYEQAGVSHLDLYFDEHFPDIIRNFDLVTTSRFDVWSNGVSARLAGLSKDIDVLGKARRGIDSRMDRLEKRISEVE